MSTTKYPGYHLQRNYRATSRLNMQHLVYSHIQPYHIHPSIPLPSTANIADVGTGTGMWLLDLGQQLPKSTSLHGFDLDLSQAPNEAWLPDNVRMHKWDLTKRVPEDFRGRYDLTHARFFIQVVREGDAGSVLEQLKALTKPGGWIQWTEQNIWSQRLVKTSETNDASASEELLARFNKFLLPRAGDEPGWGPKLDETFRAHGLQDVQADVREIPPALLPSWHDNVLLTMEEISNFVDDGEYIRNLVERASREIETSKRGIAITLECVTTIGRVV